MKHDHSKENVVQHGRKPADESKSEPHVDPVCKMFVTPETAAAKYDYNGTTYYFCNQGCKTKFAADPEKLLSEPPPLGGGQFAGRGWPPADTGGSDPITKLFGTWLSMIGMSSC